MPHGILCAKPISEIKQTPAPGFLSSTVYRQPRRRCLLHSLQLSSRFGIGTEIKFTLFLISAPFIGTHTLLQPQYTP